MAAERKTRRARHVPQDEMAALRQEIAHLRAALQAINQSQQQYSTIFEKLDAMNRISRHLNVLDIDKIGQVAVTEIPQLVLARRASLFLHDYEHDRLVLRAHNHPEPMPQHLALPVAPNTVMGIAVRQERPLVIHDFDEYQKTHGITLVRTFAEKYATRSCVSVPLKVDRYIVGVLNLADKIDDAPFSELEDVPLVDQLGQVMAMALRNCRLFEEVQAMAHTDSLTHLMNHRSFYERLGEEMHRAGRYQRPLSLLMIDVDDFKRVNDQYGHTVGDHVLRAIAAALRSTVRREDFLARYGGDEMALLLPETPLDGALHLGLRLLRIVRDLKIPLADASIGITVSIGAADWAPGMTITQFIDAADRALYRAKHTGKDRLEEERSGQT